LNPVSTHSFVWLEVDLLHYEDRQMYMLTLIVLLFSTALLPSVCWCNIFMSIL